MTKTLNELRSELAQQLKRYFTGTATGGGKATIIDANGLKHFTNNDQLNGALAYIREDAGGAGAAPEGESRFITDYVAATQTITVEYDWTANVTALDVYEIFLAPLTLDDWDLCLERAVDSSWPELFDLAEDTVALEEDEVLYTLDTDAESVESVSIMTGDDWGEYPLPRLAWNQEGDPGGLSLRLRQMPRETGRRAKVMYKVRWTLPSGTDTTGLDPVFIIDAAAAYVLEMLANKAGDKVAAQRYLQLMTHYQERAANRKRALQAERLGILLPDTSRRGAKK